MAVVDTVLLKVVSRCILNCTYCYVYNMGDEGWRSQPKRMSESVQAATVEQMSDLVRLQGFGVSPATGRFLTSHRDGTMRLRDLDSGKEIRRVQLHDGKWEGNGTSLSADGRFGLSSTFRHTTYLLRLPPVPKKGEQEQK